MAGFDWIVSVLIISGFLLGLLTEHLLHIMGFEHSHAGHARAMPGSRANPQLMVGGAHFGIVKAPASDAESGDLSNDHGMRTGIIINILVGDFFHNLFDGIAIGSAFLSCGQLGWLVTASVIVHELPQELSDFIILVRAGLSIPAALLLNLTSSLSAVIGAIAAVLVGQGQSERAQLTFNIGRVLAFSAGILLYVGGGLCAEVPRIKGKGTSAVAWLFLCFGIVINGLLKMWDIHCESCGAGHDDGHGH